MTLARPGVDVDVDAVDRHVVEVVVRRQQRPLQSQVGRDGLPRGLSVPKKDVQALLDDILFAPAQGRSGVDKSAVDSRRKDAATRGGTMREWRSASAPWFVGVVRWRRTGRRVTLMTHE
jgi:hypothetical protein